MSLFNKQKNMIESTVQRPNSNHKQVKLLSNSMSGVRITSQRYTPTFEPTEPRVPTTKPRIPQPPQPPKAHGETKQSGNGSTLLKAKIIQKKLQVKLIAISGMNKDPVEYTKAVQARANLAHATFSRPDVESYYYDEGINTFNILLSAGFDAFNQDIYLSPSKKWNGSSQSNRLSFVTGNIGNMGGTLPVDVKESVDKFGQGPGFNFTEDQKIALGLDETVISNTDAVAFPITTWQRIFTRYSEASRHVSNSALGAMITSLFGDHFFNQNKLPVEDDKEKYKRSNWSTEQATQFMLKLSKRLTDQENILENYRMELEELNGYSTESVELIYKPLANLRKVYGSPATEATELSFLEEVTRIAMDMLATAGCSALEYDGLAVHCALLCMYYKDQGMDYKFNSLIAGTTTTIKQVCQHFHQSVVLWSVGLEPAIGELGVHINKLLDGGVYINKTYTEVLFYHDLGLDSNLDDYIAINLLLKIVYSGRFETMGLTRKTE